MDLSHPHDSFVRSWLSQPEQLAEFLRLCLPKETLAMLDLSTLAIGDGTFVDEEHREHYSDIQATVATRSGGAYVYILTEHKSYNDRWALLQILRYMVQTWTRDSRDNRSEPLKLIIPVLFYHGETEAIRTTFGELFPDELDPVLSRYRPEFKCDIFNLTAMSDSLIAGPPEQEAALWALKYARTQLDVVFRALERLCDSVEDAFFQSPMLKSIELYLLASGDATPEEVLDRMTAIVTNFHLRGDTMNTAQQLVARGRMEGKIEGRLEGKLEGKIEGINEGHLEATIGAARRLKALGVSVEIICQATGLGPEEIDRL